MSYIVRKNTLSINLRNLTQRVNALYLHELVAEQIKIPEINILSLEIDHYKRCAFIKTSSTQAAEQAIIQCQGKLLYDEGGLIQELPVTIENNGQFQAVVSVLPLELSDQKVADIFSQYGTIQTVKQCYYSSSYKFRIYNGKRIITFSKVTKKTPVLSLSLRTKVTGIYEFFTGRVPAVSCHPF